MIEDTFNAFDFINRQKLLNLLTKLKITKLSDLDNFMSIITVEFELDINNNNEIIVKGSRRK